MYDVALSVSACARSGTRADVAWMISPTASNQAVAFTPGGGRVGRLAEGAFDGLLADVAARVILTAREGRFDKAGRTITARLDGRGTLALTNCLDRLQQVMSWDLASDCTLRLQS